MLFVMIAKHWNKLIKQTSLCQKRLNTLIWWILKTQTLIVRKMLSLMMKMIKAKLMIQMNQMKMKSRNVVTCGVVVTWSGLNMLGFGILHKYVVWMMYAVICNIGFLYKKVLVKWFGENNFSSVSSSQIDVLHENLVDVARAARSIMEQYNIALAVQHCSWKTTFVHTEICCDENIH